MERIAFLVERTGERLSCLLNPNSLVMRRTAGVRPRSSSGGQVTGAKLADDPLQYTGGGATELTLDLLFDVTLAGSSLATEDVRELTRPLWELSENTAVEAGLRRPPLVRFVWGKSWNILGVVTAVAERVESFAPSGAPQRSYLRLRMQRVDDAVEGTTAERAPRGPIPELAADVEIPPEQVRVHEVMGAGSGAEGAPGTTAERLDEIAYREYGDPNYWRVIARVNDIDDPLRIPEGRRLVVPTPAALEGKS